MNNVAPQYYDGFRAAVGGAGTAAGGAKREVEAGTLATPVERSPEPVAPAALSEEERIKAELHPLDAFPRLLDGARNDRPPGREDAFRFQWFGLFYQGPQQDAFVLRVRLPGGRLQAHQLEGLAALTQELASGHVLVNAQGGLDLPGVAVRDAAGALRRLEGTGLRSLWSGGDCVRAVRGGEHEGLAKDSLPPIIYPLVCELEQALALDRRASDLPAGCEVVLCAHDEAPPTGGAEGGALVFQAIAASREGPASPDVGAPMFSLTVPGFGPLDLTVTAAQVVPACLELLRRWAEHDAPTERGHPGVAAFCAGVGNRRLREWLTLRTGPLADLPPGPPAKAVSPPAGVPVPGGYLLSGELERLAEVARKHGSNEWRLARGELFVPRADDPLAAETGLRDALALR